MLKYKIEIIITYGCQRKLISREEVMANKYLEVWLEYLALEEELLQIIDHIPLVKNHFNVWSLKIGGIFQRV